MSKKEKINNEAQIINFFDVKPIEFLKVLSLYGMMQKEYCDLSFKSKGWFSNVVMKQEFLTYKNIEIFTNHASIEVFDMLLNEVRKRC